MEKVVSVRFDTAEINIAGVVPSMRCNAIIFLNRSLRSTGVILYVNNIPVYGEDSLSMACDIDEVDTTNYNVRFSGAGLFFVVRKFVNK